MSEARAVNPLVEQFRSGGVARDLRLMAAQGALPLKPEDLLELLTDLLRDPDPEVGSAALGSLQAFPAADFLAVAKGKMTAPAVLAWAAEHRPERELRESALQNVALTDEAMEALASALPTELAELVVINQTRLLRRTTLLVAIESNASLSNDQRRRLRELRETFKIGPDAATPPPPAPAPAPAPTPPAEPEPEPEPGPLSEAEAVERYLAEDEKGEVEKVSAVQRIYRMTTAEKVILALKGNREERAMLVRDPNRVICIAVLGSPRLTDTEIDAFAGMKNVSSEVLRKIGTHREWAKRYAVVANLVKNPRTPVGISLTMVPRLSPRDLKQLSTDKNVPEVIRKAAQRFVRSAHGDR